jgi:SAM-dependent methyltransferase
MTMPLDLERFRIEYRRAVPDVMRFVTPERQRAIAQHNIGLEPARTNLSAYLKASEKRYLRALRLLDSRVEAVGAERRALDVGGFLGAYPLALARLEVSVALAEAFAYYNGALDDLSRFLASEGVEIIDADFTAPLDLSSSKPFTMVTNMAMLEHLAASPEQLMRNIRAVTDDAGALLVEVPNIAYWPNRVKLLRGQSVHPALEVVYESATPFLGHHREYTVAELQKLLEWTGFCTLAIDQFNYSISFGSGLYPVLVQLLPTLLIRNSREVIMALAVPRVEA